MSCLYFAALLRACIVMLVIKSVDLSKKKKKEEKKKDNHLLGPHTKVKP
jgi:hypothetical protein